MYLFILRFPSGKASSLFNVVTTKPKPNPCPHTRDLLSAFSASLIDLNEHTRNLTFEKTFQEEIVQKELTLNYLKGNSDIVAGSI